MVGIPVNASNPRIRCIEGPGTIFKITSSGAFTQLYKFAGAGFPNAAMIQAVDGNFYDAVSGSIFKITATGTLTPT